MSDITTVGDTANSRGDYAMNGADLLSGQDLYTAVLISLFTDRLAEPSDIIPDGTNDPRGWVGDEAGSPLIGSRLWLLDRAKLPTDVLTRSKDYCVEALQWLLDDGVVARVDITTSLLKTANAVNGLGIYIVFYRQDGARLPALQYDYVWSQL